MATSRVVQPCLVSPFTHRQPLLLVAVLSLLLAGCGKGDSAAPAAPPTAQVGVLTVTQGDVGLVTELPGRLEASPSPR